MKIFLFLSFFIYNLVALDAISAIPNNQKQVVSRIIKTLQLPLNKETKKIIYDKISFAFDDGWSAHWTTNTTAAQSKIKNSKTQICDVSIYNNNRIVNATFVYFSQEKQLFVTLKQYIDAESTTVLEAYKKTKNDPMFKLKNETDNYAYFNEKGYMSYVTYHINAPAGMVIYESSYVIDIQ